MSPSRDHPHLLNPLPSPRGPSRAKYSRTRATLPRLQKLLGPETAAFRQPPVEPSPREPRRSGWGLARRGQAPRADPPRRLQAPGTPGRRAATGPGPRVAPSPSAAPGTAKPAEATARPGPDPPPLGPGPAPPRAPGCRLAPPAAPYLPDPVQGVHEALGLHAARSALALHQLRHGRPAPRSAPGRPPLRSGTRSRKGKVAPLPAEGKTGYSTREEPRLRDRSGHVTAVRPEVGAWPARGPALPRRDLVQVGSRHPPGLPTLGWGSRCRGVGRWEPGRGVTWLLPRQPPEPSQERPWAWKVGTERSEAAPRGRKGRLRAQGSAPDSAPGSAGGARGRRACGVISLREDGPAPHLRLPSDPAWGGEGKPARGPRARSDSGPPRRRETRRTNSASPPAPARPAARQGAAGHA